MGEYAFFTEAAAQTFRAAAAAIVPDTTDGPGGEREDVLAIADLALARRPERDRKNFLLFLGALEKLPILRYGRPFSKLTVEKRVRVLRFFEHSVTVPKFRQGFFGLKTFILMGFYGSEASFAELEYPGPRLDAPFYSKKGGPA
jgi:hypothetical protein